MSEFETHEGLPREAEVLRARRESLERLREAGIEPFAMGFDVNAHAADLLAEFEDRLENEEESDRRASVAGRVVLARRHGKLTFLVIRDRTGDLQLFCEEATLGAGYGLLEEIDLGDIVGATGHVVRTRRGELSLKVDSLTMLTKALRPLPEKWHGLQDPDLQQRRRYLHLITDPTAREYVAARATVLRTIRRELDDRGYTEVETPVLQAVAGGRWPSRSRRTTTRSTPTSSCGSRWSCTSSGCWSAASSASTRSAGTSATKASTASTTRNSPCSSCTRRTATTGR